MDWIGELEAAIAEAEQRRRDVLYELGKVSGRLETLRQVLGLVNGNDTTAVFTGVDSSDGEHNAAKTDSENGQSTA